MLLLDVWYYRVGCANLMKKRKERRLILYGLPLHLWCRKLFIDIGDLCGGFLKLDSDDMVDSESVVIIVTDGGEIPSFVLVEDDSVAYKVVILETAPPQLVPKHDSLVGREVSKLITEEEWWRRQDQQAGKAMANSGPRRNLQSTNPARGQGRVVRYASPAREWRPRSRLCEGKIDDGQVAAFGRRNPRRRNSVHSAGFKYDIRNRLNKGYRRPNVMQGQGRVLNHAPAKCVKMDGNCRQGGGMGLNEQSRWEVAGKARGARRSNRMGKYGRDSRSRVSNLLPNGPIFDTWNR